MNELNADGVRTKWHIGDECLRPSYRIKGLVANWAPAVVIATRRNEVVVRSYGWEYTHPAYEIQPRSNWRELRATAEGAHIDGEACR